MLMRTNIEAAIAAASAASPPMNDDEAIETVQGRTLHLDGDYLAYYAAGKSDKTQGMARLNALNIIEMKQMLTGSQSVVVDLSGKGCTKADRYLIAMQRNYQGTRSGGHPDNWQYLRSFLEGYTGNRFVPHIWYDREADDGIAHAAAKADIAIATRDKDMRSLPGLHINWTTSELVTVPRDAQTREIAAWDILGTDGTQYGLKWYYTQLLAGDSADNIPGLPRLNGLRCGYKRAQNYLEGTTKEQAFVLIVEAYRTYWQDVWADKLAEQAALLWLRTDDAASISNVQIAFPAHYELHTAITSLQRKVEERKHAARERADKQVTSR